MNFESGGVYHVYNQGNNRQPIFFSRANYFFFLKKMRKQFVSQCDVLAYCLMPNHFHWLLYVKKVGKGRNAQNTRPTAPSGQTGEQRHPLVTKIAILLSSYAQAINNQENRSGSLFRQKTKAVEIDSRRYGLTCFHYIHQNPLRAGLVTKLNNWEFSSYRDYAGLRDGTLINRKRAQKMFDINLNSFLDDSYQALDADIIDLIM